MVSAYNPKAEADRYVDMHLHKPRPQSVVVVGEALGYLSSAIARIHPGCNIISIYFSEELMRNSLFSTANSWSPASEESLPLFLTSRLTEFDLQGLQMIEWPPSSHAFPEASQQALQSIKSVVAFYNGCISTTSAFGKRWMKNALFNFYCINQVASLKNISTSIILIAASGPSLSRSLALIRRNRTNITLWSLPSSLTALLENGIRPDAVVLTDAGYYSLMHIRPIREEKAIPLIMPLTAVRGAGIQSSPAILINQGSYIEEILISSSQMPSIRVPPNGTVANSALDFANLFGVKVVFAGLDLANSDLHTHINPHAFDMFVDSPAYRLNPKLSRRFERAFGAVITGNKSTNNKTTPLSTYAAWFRLTTKGKSNLFRLFPSEVELPGMISLKEDTFDRLLHKSGISSEQRVLSLHNAPILSGRIDIILSLLSDWISRVEQEEKHRTRNLPTPRDFLNIEILNTIYFLSTQAVLSYCSPDRSISATALFSKACAETKAFLENLREQYRKLLL